MPPAAALEREMAKLGVSAKQANKARQAFERSAQDAGFFAQGTDRLVIPSGFEREGRKSNKDFNEPPPPPGSGNGGSNLPPFIQGLLSKLPKTEGAVWSMAERTKWLQTASNIFDLMYLPGDDSELSVIKIELTKL